MLHSKKRDVTLMGNISKKFLFSVCCNCVASLCQFDTFLRLPQIVKHSNYKPSSVLKLVRDYLLENFSNANIALFTGLLHCFVACVLCIENNSPLLNNTL